MVAVLQGSGTIGTYENIEGPESFNAVALYGEAFEDLPQEIDVRPGSYIRDSEQR